MFLDSRMGKRESTRNRDDPGGEQEKINGALNLLYLKYGMDWEEYTHQNSCTSTKRWTTEGDGSGSSNNAELVMGSDIRFTICVSTGPTTHNIPESSVQINPVEAESLKEKESSVNSSTQIPTEYKISNAKEKGKEKEKEKEMMIVSSSVKRNHVCDICDMSFSSHQALGGHMTKHSESKRKPGGGHKKKNVEREHVCEICGEVYPTGQQLGGHKSKHRSKPISESSSLVIIKEEGKGSTPVIDKEKGEVAKGDVNDGGTEQVPVECRAPAARVGRDFDLNVAAVPMEEDGDHALLSLKLWVHN